MPFILVLFCLLFASSFIPKANHLLAHSTPEPALQFVKNNNQWDTEILYRAALPGGFLFIKKQSLQYVFYDTEAVSHLHAQPKKDAFAKQSYNPGKDNNIRAHGFEVTFDGANVNPKLIATGESIEKKNYLLGNDPFKWASNVPAFSEIIYKEVYPGIDLKLYTANQSLKYEFILSPKADARQIKLRYTGADKVYIQDGFLNIQTSVNKVRETPPYCYQMIEGTQQVVQAQFKLENNLLQFVFPKGYNKKYPLIIDPLLVFSTYSGSFTDNWGFTATFDEEGNVYSGGIEFGNRFPATNGSFQVSFAREIDVAILKYSPDGKNLIYATYLGGDSTDVPHSMIVNSSNELIVLGTTSSLTFPVTVNAFDNSFNGGTYINPISGVEYDLGSDLFITQLNSSGSGLIGSTFLGGSGNDGINVSSEVSITSYGDQFRGEVNTDKEGNIYIASTTTSADFPLNNPSQASLQGSQDAIMCKLNNGLSNLLWSTYLGGTGFDATYSIRVGDSGNVYVCGGTTSRDLPAGASVIRPVFADREDGFVARFENNALTSLSYIGTDQADQAYLLDLDKEENVYVTGLTYGLYPVTAGVYSNGSSGQFIHAMNNDFTQTLFATTIGSGIPQPNLSPTAFLVSDCDFIYLSGWGGEINGRTTRNLPVTPDALRSTTNGDDFYFIILDKSATSLLYGTFLGDPAGRNHVDGGTSRFDKKGTIYHSACVCRGSSGFPTTPGVWSNRNNNENCNNLAFKFDLDGLEADFDIINKGQVNILTGCTPFTATFSNTTEGGKTYQWNIADLTTSTNFNADNYTFDQPGEYLITLTAYNPLTCKKVDSVSKKLILTPANFNISPPVTLCFGESTQLEASGGVKYAWEPARGLNDPTSPTPVATPDRTTTYTVTITNEFGCVEQRTVQVEVAREIALDFDLIISSECGKPSTVRFENRSSSGDRNLWIMGNGDTLTAYTPDTYTYPISGGTYEVVLQVFRGLCQESKSKVIEVESGELPPNVITPNGDEKNEVFIAPNIGSKLEIYNRWGKPIYQSESYQNNWGQEVPNGIYYYLITSPQGATCKGWIHVLH